MKPILKWPGGKRQLMPEILRRLPESWGTYFEPFFGGGATFFELSSQGRIVSAVVGDVCLELVETYRAVRDDPQLVSDLLEEHERKHDEAYYYETRSARPDGGAELAAWFLFINRAGFNGLFRVNRAGRCNVPWGKRKRLGLPTAATLQAAAVALHGVGIERMDFEVACELAEPGDLVYCDPPYLNPTNGKGGFVSYSSDGFGERDHERLALAFWDLVDRGVFAIVHNADCPLARDLYAGATIDVVQGRRAINRSGAGRGPVAELIVTPPR